MSREEQWNMSVAQDEKVETIKILITDRIAKEGITLLRTELPRAQIDERPGMKPDQLKAIIGEYHALIVRSETQVTGDILAAAPWLKIVGRAGVGVDNIDIEAATRQGIMVVNSPTGNIVAAAEHTIAMLMALARQIPAANNSTKTGKWVKRCFLGVGVRNRVLCIIGLGKVGTEVARRAQQRVTAPPHLGDSTEEAQVGVAKDVAEQVVSVLRGDFPRAAVNAPLILPDTLKILQPYMRLVEQMGRLYTQLQPGPIHKIEISCSGDIASYDLRPLQAALVKGLLESVSDAHVNMINAPTLAKQWGLEIIEQKSTTPAEFANLITLRMMNANGYPSSFAGKPGSGDEHVEVISGAVMHGEPRIVRVGRYWVEFVPEGYILFCRNPDQPGMIGRVGTVLGKAHVNIRHMDVGPIVRTPRQRNPQQQPDTALMIVSVDDLIPDWALQEIGAAGDIFGLTVVKL